MTKKEEKCLLSHNVRKLTEFVLLQNSAYHAKNLEKAKVFTVCGKLLRYLTIIHNNFYPQ